MRQLALVTGATGGIGKAIATSLAKQGYRVILHGRDTDKLALLLDELGPQHFTLTADLSKQAEREALIESAFNFGTVSLLVNNAGASYFADFSATKPAEIESLTQINLIAPMILSSLYLNKLESHHQKGTLINIGSALGSIGFPGFSIYCASKFGIRGFTETLAREYQSSGQRIAYFAPRTTNTTINSTAAMQMNKKMGSTVDSVEAVAAQFMAFLASNKSSKILGWPEKFFARLNGFLPELVDKAFVQKTQNIKKFTAIPSGEMK